MTATVPVMAISTARTNAELIVQCRDLGYLRDDWSTLDPTYGRGRFWTQWRPANLVASDLLVDLSPVGYSVDFRDLPWCDAAFDAVVFDPPYKLNGTPTPAIDERYGVSTWASASARHELICDGIAQCVRVLRRDGLLLVKCQDQVNGGRVRWQTREFADHAEELGCRLVDMLHLPSYRPQPAGRSQQHARRNYSTMLVLRRERAFDNQGSLL